MVLKDLGYELQERLGDYEVWTYRQYGIERTIRYNSDRDEWTISGINYFENTTVPIGFTSEEIKAVAKEIRLKWGDN